MMDADSKIWSWEAEEALLEKMRQHQHLWDSQDKLYKKQSLQKISFEGETAPLQEMFISLQNLDEQLLLCIIYT